MAANQPNRPGGKTGRRKTKSGGNRNPACDYLWSGYERYSGLAGHVMFAAKPVSASTSDWLSKNEGKAREMCVQLSLAAFARTSGEVREALSLEGPLSLDACLVYIRAVSEKFSASYDIHLVSKVVWKGKDYYRREHITSGNVSKRSRPMAFMIVPTDGNAVHCLPVCEMRDQWVACPAVTPASRPSGTVLPSASPAENRTTGNATPDNNEAVGQGVVAPPVADTRVEEALVERRVEQAEPVNIDIRGALVVLVAGYLASWHLWLHLGGSLFMRRSRSAVERRLARLERLSAQVGSPASAGRGVAVNRLEHPGENLIYDGIQPPPHDWLTWRQGSWPCYARPFQGWMKKLKNRYCRPDCCSATLEYARLHGDLVRYVDVSLDGKLCSMGRGRVICGSLMAQTFTDGDVLQDGTDLFNAVRDEEGLLKLVRVESGCMSAVKAAFYRYASQPGTLTYWAQPVCPRLELQQRVVHPPAPSVNMMTWQLNTLTNKDAVETAILERLKQDAAEKQYAKGTLDADEVALFTKRMRALYPGIDNVAGRFAWGYCYSCGKELPGRFPARLCTEACSKGKNSGLGKMVAEGLAVCNAAVPVRYPGVVTTPTRHPPLKKGVATFATGENFPLAHAPLRRCSPLIPHLGADHALAGSG